jgi:hypothetical protein
MFSRWLCLATKADVLTHVKPLPLPDDVIGLIREFSRPLLRYPRDYKEAMEALSVFNLKDWDELKAKLSSKDADEAVVYVRAFTKAYRLDIEAKKLYMSGAIRFLPSLGDHVAAYCALNMYISGVKALEEPEEKHYAATNEKPPRKGKYRGNEELLEYVREPDLYQPELDCDQSIEYLFRNGKYYDIITLDLVAWTKSTGEIVRI